MVVLPGGLPARHEPGRPAVCGCRRGGPAGVDPTDRPREAAAPSVSFVTLPAGVAWEGRGVGLHHGLTVGGRGVQLGVHGRGGEPGGSAVRGRVGGGQVLATEVAGVGQPRVGGGRHLVDDDGGHDVDGAAPAVRARRRRGGAGAATPTSAQEAEEEKDAHQEEHHAPHHPPDHSPRAAAAAAGWLCKTDRHRSWRPSASPTGQ